MRYVAPVYWKVRGDSLAQVGWGGNFLRGDWFFCECGYVWRVWIFTNLGPGLPRGRAPRCIRGRVFFGAMGRFCEIDFVKTLALAGILEHK